MAHGTKIVMLVSIKRKFEPPNFESLRIYCRYISNGVQRTASVTLSASSSCFLLTTIYNYIGGKYK